MKFESISANVNLLPLFRLSAELLLVVAERVTIRGVLGIDVILLL